MLLDRVCTISSGKVLTMTHSELSSCSGGRRTSVVSAAAPNSPGSDCSHSRRMPLLSLSKVVTVTSTTLGSRLKCISGTHIPAMAESSSRLCFSVR